MKHLLSRVTALVVLASASLPEVQAATVVSNLGNFHNGNFGIIQEAPFTRGRAQSFTTGSEPFLLQSATLAMSDIGASGTGGFHVNLYSNSGNNLPGTLLLPLNGTEAPLTSGQHTFLASASFELAPQTTYWIVAELPLNGPVEMFYYWTFSVDSSEVALPGWSMGASADSSSFMGWEPTWGPQSVPLRMALEVAAVPEPAAVWWLAVATMGLGASRRRVRI